MHRSYKQQSEAAGKFMKGPDTYIELLFETCDRFGIHFTTCLYAACCIQEPCMEQLYTLVVKYLKQQLSLSLCTSLRFN